MKEKKKNAGSHTVNWDWRELVRLQEKAAVQRLRIGALNQALEILERIRSRPLAYQMGFYAGWDKEERWRAHIKRNMRYDEDYRHGYVAGNSLRTMSIKIFKEGGS